MRIGESELGPGKPVYTVAELSCNHDQDFDHAVRLIKAAKKSGADAVKIQTYTADTLTLKSDKPHFRIQGTIWEGQTLHDLYQKAYTPWEWHPKLKDVADDLGIELFSSPFDFTAVDLLEEMNVNAYKIASFEIVDIPLIQKVARTGKPTIMSTGMATEAEIREAVDAFRSAGGTELVLLKCTSAYPAPPELMNLSTIPDIRKKFNVDVGLSDHTLHLATPIAAVALGAVMVEKHFILDRSAGGPDSSFSLEPDEFAEMVRQVRIAEKELGQVTYGGADSEKDSRRLRRSLFVTDNIKPGEVFSERNVRSIRPGNGLHTRHYEEVLGKRAKAEIEKGTPLSWEHIESP